MTEHVTADEQFLLVEEVAHRLGLPLAVLLGRVEAGDVPARRIENENGVHYSLRLSDLGIEPMDGDGSRAGFMTDKGDVVGVIDITGHRVPDGPADQGEHPGGVEDGRDRREPAQPAPGLRQSWVDSDTDMTAHAVVVSTSAAAAEQPDANDAGEESPAAGDADLAMPPPPVIGRHPAGLLDTVSTPHSDLAVMSLDARELVTGLLDRWERTLEQRIYTEQRQRFEGELLARQNMVKQLQAELHTARAEHAAAQAEKDRSLAEKERELADRERQLADARRLADETDRLLAPAITVRRRRRFWQRGDV